MKRHWIIVLLTLLPLAISAQNDREMMDKLLAEDLNELEAIAMYPEDIRTSILETSIHPEVLVRMQSLQQQTSEQFKTLLGRLNRDDQERLWEITRYPGLLEKISVGGKKSRDELEAIAADFPEGIRESVVEYGRREYEILTEVHKLNQIAEQTFDRILAPYPSRTHSAYRDLLDHPEILSILSENMNLTVVLGDLYQRNPSYVLQQTDSIALVLAETNAKELEDWKKSLEEDPEALKDLEAAAGEYAREQGYPEQVYTQPVTEVTEIRYVYRPYPYWYGYPWWYEYDYAYDYYWYDAPVVYVRAPRRHISWWYVYPRWYPRPWWYEWGFYYGPGGQIVVWNLPSYHFCWWHFNLNYHHYYYPHLSSHLVGWHRGHRESTSSLSRAVRTWEEENKAHLPSGFLNDDPGRVERFKEYGHFETSLAEYNQTHPGKEVGRSVYLEKHERSYPNLVRPSGNLQADPLPAPAPVRSTKLKEPTWDTRPKTEPSRTPVRSEPPRIETVPPRTNQQIIRAKDYHQGTWERSNPQPTPQRVPVRVTPPSRNPVNPAPRTPTQRNPVTPSGKAAIKGSRSK